MDRKYLALLGHAWAALLAGIFPTLSGPIPADKVEQMLGLANLEEGAAAAPAKRRRRRSKAVKPRSSSRKSKGGELPSGNFCGKFARHAYPNGATKCKRCGKVKRGAKGAKRATPKAAKPKAKAKRSKPKAAKKPSKKSTKPATAVTVRRPAPKPAASPAPVPVASAT